MPAEPTWKIVVGHSKLMVCGNGQMLSVDEARDLYAELARAIDKIDTSSITRERHGWAEGETYRDNNGILWRCIARERGAMFKEVKE